MFPVASTLCTECMPRMRPFIQCGSRADHVIMYENVQAPMLEAAAGGNGPSAASSAVNPFKNMLRGGSASGNLVSVRHHIAPTSLCKLTQSDSPGHRLAPDSPPLIPLHSVAIHSRRSAPLQGQRRILSLRWVHPSVFIVCTAFWYSFYGANRCGRLWWRADARR